MATPPTAVADGDNGVGTSSPLATGTLTILNGDILVGMSGADGAGTVNLALATTTGETYTNKALDDSGSDAQATCRIDGTTATADRSATISMSETGSTHWAMNGSQWRGSAGFGAAAHTNSGAGSGAPSLAITTTADNSAILMVVSDWNARDGASRTYSTVNGITPSAGGAGELFYAFASGFVTYYFAYWSDAGAAGSKTVGMATPNNQRYAIAALEIKGAASAAGPIIHPVMISQAVKRASYW